MTFPRIFLPPPIIFEKIPISGFFLFLQSKQLQKNEKDWFIDHLSDRSVLVGGS